MKWHQLSSIRAGLQRVSRAWIGTWQRMNFLPAGYNIHIHRYMTPTTAKPTTITRTTTTPSRSCGSETGYYRYIPLPETRTDNPIAMDCNAVCVRKDD